MKINTIKLRSARMTKGWTQADLAYATGLSRSFISQLESGKRGAHPEIVKVLGEFLETDLQIDTICPKCGEHLGI